MLSPYETFFKKTFRIGEEQICRTKVLYDLLCVPHDVINERKLLKPTNSVIVKLNFKALFIIFLLAGVNKFIIMQIMPATFFCGKLQMDFSTLKINNEKC